MDPELEGRTLAALRPPHAHRRSGACRPLPRPASAGGAAQPRPRRTSVDTRLLTMLAWGLGSGASGCDSLDAFLEKLCGGGGRPSRNARAARCGRRTLANARGPSRCSQRRSRSRCTLATPRQEVIAALGFGEGVKPKVTQGGILWVPQAAERRLLRRSPQGRARLLADDDVPGLRDQPRAVPLGVTVAADARAADRPALHRPRRARNARVALRRERRASSSARSRSRSSGPRST